MAAKTAISTRLFAAAYLYRRPGRCRRLSCDAVFAEHLRSMHVTPPDGKRRGILFAVDDSDPSEHGARFVMQRVARPGDFVHFVHVIADNRSPFVSVGNVGNDSEDLYYCSSVDVFEAFPLKEHRKLLETRGEQMLKKRVAAGVPVGEAIRTKYHLPILTRPESASEIASVLCGMSDDLGVDILGIVSPSSGVFLKCGSVGYHVYEQAKVPVLLLPNCIPPAWPSPADNVILILVNSESERRTAEDWIRSHMAHVFNPYKFVVACVEESCGCEISDEIKEMVCEMQKTGEKLSPACVVMYSSAEKTVLDQLQECPFVVDYDQDNRYMIVLLPKLQSPVQEEKTYWSDYSYSEDEIMET